MIHNLPKKIVISEVIASRYTNGIRPASWDKRISGIDVIKTTEGEVVKLFSDGMQSTPRKNWTILLNSGSSETGFQWTLYGIV